MADETFVVDAEGAVVVEVEGAAESQLQRQAVVNISDGLSDRAIRSFHTFSRLWDSG